MNKLALCTVALIVGLSDFTGGTMFSAANAETSTVRRFVNRDVCYRARKVPATFSRNTKGILLSGASRSWEGNMQRHGSKVRNRYNDEVYIQTETLVEDQHVTLVPVPC